MRWAAVSLLALSALCAPAVAQAQEDTLTASATAALRGLGGAFLDRCFAGRPAAPLRIAIAEIATSRTFSDSAARIITDRIEAALEKDPLFMVVPRRLSAELGVIRKELQESGPLAPGGPLDGFVTIKPDADAGGQTTVVLTAYTADLNCQRSAESPVRVGDIKDPPDDPEAYFKFALRDLDERQINQLLVMPPDIGVGIGGSNGNRAAVRQLQDGLAAAIRRTFDYRRRLRLSDSDAPSVGLYGEGSMKPSESWQARMRLGRSARGIEVDIQFRSPDNPARVIDAPAAGHFALEILPNLDPPVLRMPAEKTFRVKAEPLEVEVEVLKGPSHLFCFFLESNGEATLLYPTSSTISEHVFTAGDKRFPNDFFPGMKKPWTFNAPNDFFFYCAATRRSPPDDLQGRWLQNTVQERQRRNQSDSVDPDMTRKILSELRGSDGYAEASTRIVFK